MNSRFPFILIFFLAYFISCTTASHQKQQRILDNKQLNRWENIKPFDKSQWHLVFGWKNASQANTTKSPSNNDEENNNNTTKIDMYDWIGYAIGIQGLQQFVNSDYFDPHNQSFIYWENISNKNELIQSLQYIADKYKELLSNTKGNHDANKGELLSKFNPDPKSLLNKAIENRIDSSQFFDWDATGFSQIKRMCSDVSEVVLFYFNQKNNSSSKLSHASRRYRMKSIPSELISWMGDNIFISRIKKSYVIAHHYEWSLYGKPRIGWCSDHIKPYKNR